MHDDPVGSSVECLLQSAQGRLYRPLPLQDSKAARMIHASNLPRILTTGEATHFFTLNGMMLARGHVRVVVGDHGAYVEFDDSQIIKSNLVSKFKGEPKKAVKDIWYTPKDGSGVQVYHQQDMVAYADYRIGFWYINPRDMVIV